MSASDDAIESAIASDKFAHGARMVKQFNAEHPIGTAVEFWPGIRVGTPRRSTTRSTAWVLPSGTAVVFVTGYPGGIALTHVEVC